MNVASETMEHRASQRRAHADIIRTRLDELMVADDDTRNRVVAALVARQMECGLLEINAFTVRVTYEAGGKRIEITCPLYQLKGFPPVGYSVELFA